MSYVVGVDVGSTYTKAVVLSPEKDVVGKAMVQTGFKLDKASEKALDEVLKGAGLTRDEIGYSISTGLRFLENLLVSKTLAQAFKSLR